MDTLTDVCENYEPTVHNKSPIKIMGNVKCRISNSPMVKSTINSTNKISYNYLSHANTDACSMPFESESQPAVTLHSTENLNGVMSLKDEQTTNLPAINFKFCELEETIEEKYLTSAEAEFGQQFQLNVTSETSYTVCTEVPVKGSPELGPGLHQNWP